MFDLLVIGSRENKEVAFWALSRVPLRISTMSRFCILLESSADSFSQTESHGHDLRNCRLGARLT